MWVGAGCRCTNLEAQVVSRINENISSLSVRTKALDIANYYLYNEGGNISTVAKVALGVDIDGTMAKVSSQLIKVTTKRKSPSLSL